MKRGQGLSIQTIVIAALALVVLVILIFVIRGQIQKGTQKYINISSEAELQSRAKDRCQTMFSGRECFKDKCPDKGYIEMPGTWPDCTEMGRSKCCERASI